MKIILYVIYENNNNIIYFSYDDWNNILKIIKGIYKVCEIGIWVISNIFQFCVLCIDVRFDIKGENVGIVVGLNFVCYCNGVCSIVCCDSV